MVSKSHIPKYGREQHRDLIGDIEGYSAIIRGWR